MSANSSEQVKVVQKILETLDEQKVWLERSVSNFNRRKIEVESQLKEDQVTVKKATEALEQTRIHLRVELEKLDPAFHRHRCTDVNCGHESHKLWPQ